MTIRERVPGARLPDSVPPAYREELAALALQDDAYTLVLFAHDRRDVVPSAAVRRAFRRLGEHSRGRMLAVGAVFTDEAMAMLEGRGAQVLSLHRQRWTDEQARARQL